MASSPSFLIRNDAWIGTFFAGGRDTLGAAVGAFGQPDRREFNTLVNACTATWAAIGLRMVFVNFVGDDPCGNTTGFFVKATMRSPGMWKTERGLRLGSDVTLLRQLYRRATYDQIGANWWLITRLKRSAGGRGSHFPGLLAHIRDARVVSFTVRATVVGRLAHER